MHITQGMVRANGKVQAKAVSLTVVLTDAYAIRKTYVPRTCYSCFIHRVQWPYKAVCVNHHACNIEFVKKKHCRDLQNDGPKHNNT